MTDKKTPMKSSTCIHMWQLCASVSSAQYSMNEPILQAQTSPCDTGEIMVTHQILKKTDGWGLLNGSQSHLCTFFAGTVTPGHINWTRTCYSDTERAIGSIVHGARIDTWALTGPSDCISRSLVRKKYVLCPGIRPSRTIQAVTNISAFTKAQLVHGFTG